MIKFKEEIAALRKNFPVGIRFAEELLLKTQGNVLLAEKLFQKEMLGVFLDKYPNALPEQASEFLVNAKYDLAEAFNE
ncbi:MAG: hypothetical protein ACRCWR_00635 [Saezia sp.]